MNLLVLIGHIFMNSMIPILILIGVGFILDRKFKLDLYTLSKLNFYILLPTFIFRAMYEAKLNSGTLEIVFVAFCVLILNSILATPYANLGLVSVVSIMIIQTISSNTYGFYQAGAGRLSPRDALKVVFHMPMVYAIPMSLLCQLLPFDLHGLFFFAPLNIFANAFVGVAMIALGVQINRTPLNFFKLDVMLATTLRLVISPIIAAAMTILFIKFYGPMHPIAAQTIIITYSVPTAINMSLIAIEMKNNPEYATQIVMGTTILSAVTMPLFITIAYYLFPLY